MENIKLRAWDSDKNKFEFLDVVHQHTIMTSLSIPSRGTWDKLKPFQQYTSLKDKNGKEIWEGDILFYAERNQWYKVFKVGGGFAVNTHQDDFRKEKVYFYTGLSDMQNGSWVSGLEVKGNIYETPELLCVTAEDYDITKEE